MDNVGFELQCGQGLILKLFSWAFNDIIRQGLVKSCFRNQVKILIRIFSKSQVFKISKTISTYSLNFQNFIFYKSVYFRRFCNCSEWMKFYLKGLELIESFIGFECLYLGMVYIRSVLSLGSPCIEYFSI